MRRSSSRNAMASRSASEDASLLAPPMPAGGAAADASPLASSFLTSMNVSPFLFKTWNLVSDPATDSIVSWAPDGLTFLVSKPDAMEREILPHVFKHSNFASFVRQLNNYGFRKVSTDRYEFGVTGFQRGAPELLKTLKRHDASRGAKKATSKAHQASAAHYDDEAQAPASPGALLEVGAYGGMQSEVDQLKRDRLLLLKEVMRLRESSAHAAEEMRGLSARLAQTESVQQQMLGFLQQHIAPTLINANSHRLQPRKRRHLLLPPSPGRDGDAMEFSLPSGPVQAPQAQPEFEDVFMPVDQPQLSLHELPEDGALATSYHRTRPAPNLPQVLSLPDASPPSAEGLEWSDLLYDAQAAVAASGSPEAPGLARMNSDDIHRILKEMQLDAFEPLPCVGEGAAA